MELLSHYAVHLLNGLAYGLLLFLLSVGLSLIFGLMDVMNLAHGSFYMLAAYLAVTVIPRAGFGAALVTAPAVLGLLGLGLAWFFLRPLYGRGHLDQVLLTLGLAYIFADLGRWIWGGQIYSIPPPEGLSGSVPVLGNAFPVYRLAVIAVGLCFAAGTWLLIERTRLGAIIRAGVSDSEMLDGLGVNVTRVFTLVFGLGAFLAGLGGVIGGPILGAAPGVDFEILILALLVVVIGGLGTIKGAFWGSLLVGQGQTLGIAILPEFSYFLLFGLMAVILLIKPAGLFGREAG